MLEDGRIAVGRLVTRQMVWRQTPDAYRLLYNRADEALAVLLEWD